MVTPQEGPLLQVQVLVATVLQLCILRKQMLCAKRLHQMGIRTQAWL